MSRACYSDGDDNPDYPLALWRGAVLSAIRGKRGQAFLRELLAAMDAMPEKRLIADKLVDGEQVCAIGTVGRARGIKMDWIDPESYDVIAGQFGISEALVREIEYENDEGGLYSLNGETPEQRWVRVRKWVEKEIIGDQS